jgi:hypothetical protein
MEISNMLDVIHFYFEEDSRYRSAEEVQSVSAVRTSLYEGMYKRPYPYKVNSNSSSTGSTGRRYVSDSNDDLEPFDPLFAETKPFVPATDFNPDSAMPFGSVLDAPIGG